MVAGMMDVPEEAKAMGAKPSWLGYIWVEDVDKALPKLTAAGGKVYKAPADIPGVGRFAVVADPDGAAFMLFKDAGGNPPPPPPPGTPGLVGWRELHAGDGARAFAFYSGQFGWKKERDHDMGPMGVYHIFDAGDGQPAGRSSTGRWRRPTADGSCKGSIRRARCSRWSRPNAEAMGAAAPAPRGGRQLRDDAVAIFHLT
jgi:predicted enzyme related to lactoylglutathione lyase